MVKACSFRRPQRLSVGVKGSRGHWGEVGFINTGQLRHLIRQVLIESSLMSVDNMIVSRRINGNRRFAS